MRYKANISLATKLTIVGTLLSVLGVCQASQGDNLDQQLADFNFLKSAQTEDIVGIDDDLTWKDLASKRFRLTYF